MGARLESLRALDNVFSGHEDFVERGAQLRASFIVDPDGVIRFVSVNDLSAGRNVDEVLPGRAHPGGSVT